MPTLGRDVGPSWSLQTSQLKIQLALQYIGSYIHVLWQSIWHDHFVSHIHAHMQAYLKYVLGNFWDQECMTGASLNMGP